MGVKISNRRLLWVLSSAIDLVGITDIYHGKRVAYIAKTLGQELDNFPYSVDDIIIAGLLHDCGVSSTDMHENLVNELEYSEAQLHCDRGADLLEKHNKYSYLAKAIKLHHTRWSEFEHSPARLLGNLIFLSDRIDVLAASADLDILIEKDSIIKRISSLSSTLFNPTFIEIFNKVASTDIFWLNWSEAHQGDVMKHWLDRERPTNIPYKELIHDLKLFAACVDGKSKYTYNHSLSVSKLTRKIAEIDGFKGDDLTKIELAGLMHDLGKLKVPDIILEKRAPLSGEEMNIMKHHSYDTFCILSQIPGMEEISKWASQHHEKLNGKGYPGHLKGDELSKQSRILAIADIYQALEQDRPYRNALKKEEILEIMEDMVKKGEIDGYYTHMLNSI